MTGTCGSSTVTHQDGDGTWIIALDGEHDISTTLVLDEQIRRLLPRCTLAIVDLSSTTFIDASVIGWLMRTRGALATGSNAMSVVRGNPGGIADRIFDILRLDAELPVYPTRPDALADGCEMRKSANPDRDTLRETRGTQ
jgi:anti-anti-sigma regulatory factor